MSLAAEKAINRLSDSSAPLSSSKLTGLNNLESEDLKIFKPVWTALDIKRRHQVIYRLVELAENNVELNFDGIFKHCLSDPDEQVRTTAIEGLWENEEPSLINRFIALLEKDNSEKVKAGAAMALGKYIILAEHGKLRSIYIPRIQQALMKAINNQATPMEVRRRALEGAASLDVPEIKLAITKAYRSEEPELKISAIYAMGRNGDPSWLPILIEELDSPDAEARYEAAAACGEMGDRKAIPHLIKLVKDPDNDVKLAAIHALGKIGGAEAKNFLKQLSTNTNDAIREAAQQALQELETFDDASSFRVDTIL